MIKGENMNHYEGECLCGACRYTITGQQPAAMYLCHCTRCQKQTGSIHCANVFFNDAQLQWQRGSDNMTYFSLEGTRKHNTFCKTCGSQMPRQTAENKVFLPAGTLDEGVELTPTAHIYYDSRATWEDGIAGAPKFAELPGK